MIVVGYAIGVVLSYLIGSITWGYIFGKLGGIDIRRWGSKNVGATHVARVLGGPRGIVVLVLYAPSLAVPFFLEDYRHLRLMAEFHAGARPSLDLYRFLVSPEDNAAQRSSGAVPWWLADQARAAYLRPLAEWSLYLDYLLWNGRPIGYHATALLLYLASVWLLLALFRIVQPDEGRARWATLLFAVAAGHGVYLFDLDRSHPPSASPAPTASSVPGKGDR